MQDKLIWKILYLLKWMYDMTENDEKEIISILEKLSEQEKIDVAYMLYKKFEVENNILKQAVLKLKTIDHDIEEYHTKQEADKWLEDLLAKVEEKRN